MGKKRISVIDYGAGNIASVINMIRHVGGDAEIISSPNSLSQAEKLLLPGVGAFDHGMQRLEDGGWLAPLNCAVLERRVPVLGICLGMQLMCKSSEEGFSAGLGWIDARVRRFKFGGDEADLKVPHMGWNLITPCKESPLIADMPVESRFYFVHSYHVVCTNVIDVLTTTTYGFEFASSFQNCNIFGVQFHPEKSHKFGMQLLKNFVEKV